MQFGIGSIAYLGAASCAKHHSLLKYSFAPVRELRPLTRALQRLTGSGKRKAAACFRGPRSRAATNLFMFCPEAISSASMFTGRPALRRARHPWMYGASARRRGRQRRGGRAAERSDSASCHTGLRRPVGVRCGLRSRQAAALPGGLEPRPVGRPRRPGRQQLRPAPPRDLDSPSTERRYQNEYYGSMRVKAWSGLHPKTRRIGERYGCERAPVVRGTVILVEVGKHSARPASRSTVALVLRRRGAGLGNAHRPC